MTYNYKKWALDYLAKANTLLKSIDKTIGIQVGYPVDKQRRGV